jgi:RIO kinase 1
LTNTADDDKREEDFDRAIEGFGIRIKDRDQVKVREDVFDEITLLSLYKLAHKKWITALGGSISTGKEANVFYAERGDQEVAVKIYRIQSADFKGMSEYITGDRRFTNIRKSRKDIVFAWTRKEYSNLMRAAEAGVAVPKPLVFNRNILIMELLGKEGIPFPQLRSCELDDPAGVYREICSMMELLHKEGDLVHADLSEYNILYGDRPYFIDMGQSVTRSHPRVYQFLKRDIANINRFFASFCEVEDPDLIFTRISGLPPHSGKRQPPAEE